MRLTRKCAVNLPVCVPVFDVKRHVNFLLFVIEKLNTDKHKHSELGETNNYQFIMIIFVCLMKKQNRFYFLWIKPSISIFLNFLTVTI